MKIKLITLLNQGFAVRKLMIFDFCCAFVGSSFWLLTLPILSVYLPYQLLLLQALANFCYGVFGFLIFLSYPKSLGLFRILVSMNFAYAAVILVTGMVSLLTLRELASLLLVGEGLLIAALARVELRSLR